MAERFPLQETRDLTPKLWDAWVDQRHADGISPKTLNRTLSLLKHFLYFLQDHDRPICERFLLLDYLDKGEDLPKDIPIAQLRSLQGCIQGETKQGLGRMDLAWFLLMLHSGLRTGEVRHLKLKDIEWEARRVRIEQSKGLKDRLVPLSEATIRALKEYLAARGPVDALPETVFVFRHAPLSKSYCAERLRTYGARCGVKATPHQLRHSCATLLLNSGAPVLAVQMILGHKQIDTTLGYARLYDGTLAADYYSAMNRVEGQLALPEDRMKEPPRIGQLIALTDALRSGSLNPKQTEIVRALREGLARMAELEMVIA
jgi:site-specific recombinase XerD